MKEGIEINKKFFEALLRTKIENTNDPNLDQSQKDFHASLDKIAEEVDTSMLKRQRSM